MSTDRLISYSEAINEALQEEMRRDADIVLMGEDIGSYGGVFKVTKGLYNEFGAERVIDMPISETGFIGAGVGAAMTGLIPIIEIMWIDFTLVALDQIVNQAAKMKYMSGGQTSIPLVIRTQGGGGRGNGAQHSQSLETIFAHIPGLKVVAPSTPYDAKGLLKSAVREGSPVIFIEHKMLYNQKGHVPLESYTIPLGQADIKRRGKDVTIVTLSRMVPFSLEAAELLSKEGIEVEVIDLRTLVPLDIAAVIQSVKQTHRLVIVHEATGAYGWGAEISARIQEEAFDELDAPIIRVTAENTPVPYNMNLEKEMLPQTIDIVNAVRKTIR
ncbi:TPP-dependent acetoin dehydrogenase complex, E1 protein subunit beta [Paenibacillus baekrokdamisoli]|uniref:TPP-dependent acetoin dehydrogenase complex, E1 protein subunit beta n=1 Tax=Paenibacillus baekrokdamisoli TaxID=1712516 RepID=A0A3G9JEA9_9BACL|nr:alpha-ketoacid dehydrogenase subunit beta [Paenibacillus baekrokdamisoli]MBB3071777.1 pyruvate dehydrogenase E1 component beta subunit [Paenibacillus baekrokdamisoli]BBH24241.1 TPP-dependent acetoin dehydrogenase complex, E1 protein subunit beta [Paenibacillus baekrokdamisoli]